MASPKEYDIFISYRREGGKNFARILKPELEKRGYQDRVFLDFDELKDGKFDKRIMDAIDSAPIFIIILSDGCLDRCVNEDDWVRQEIVHALETNRHIIPVVCDKTFSDFPVNIPEVIRKGLGQHQFTQIDTDTLLRASVNELVEYRIDPLIKKVRDIVTNSNEFGAEIHILTDADCNIMRFGKQIGAAKVDEDNIIRLLKGNHLLDFVSVEYNDIKQTLKYSVPDNDYSDFIEVKLQDSINDNKNQIELLNRKLELFKDKNLKWGFKDEYGNLVIPCKWEYAYNFREGLACIEDGNGKWGFIDKTGKVVIPCKWNGADSFYEGLARVKDYNGKYGFIDKTGKVVIPCKWNEVKYFREGLARVKDDNWKWGFIDKTGKMVIPCKWRYAENFSESLACVCDDNVKRGFIDKTGKMVIPCKWKYVGDFSESLAYVCDDNFKYGFIDKTGKLVIPCKWKGANNFKEGLAGVKDDNGNFFHIDKTGNIVER